MNKREIQGFLSDPRLIQIRATNDMTEKLRLAAEMHGGSAPWLGEPHRKEWRYKGLDCLIVRNWVGGALCGYVAVPASHPYHGMGFEDVHRINDDLAVHGGLTYASLCHGTICHEAKPGDADNVWWLGFDCAHYGDWSPLMLSLSDETYRDISYVMAETERLAEQLLGVMR